MDMELHVNADDDPQFFLVYPKGHVDVGQSERLLEGQCVWRDDDGMAWVSDAEDIVYSCGPLSDITIHGWAFHVVWDDDGILSLEQTHTVPQA